MFREMRRKNQALSSEENTAVLKRCTSGVLALGGIDYPYAVPLNYVYTDGKIFFHSAGAGLKIDLISRNSRASFCVIDKDDIIPEEYTSYFRSVIVFGKVRILENPDEKRSALEALISKYSSDFKDGGLKEIEKLLSVVCVIELKAEHISGKEAIEFVRDKQSKLS